jgi:hypothetical protein
MLLVAPTARAENASISWVILADRTAGESVDKRQAEEIYREVVELMEQQMEWGGRPLRPRITVHIGEACPASEVGGPCMNPALGVLYVSEWNDEARDAFARIIMLTAMYQILVPADREYFI